MPATRAPASSLLPRPRPGEAPERVARAVETFDAAVVRLVSPVALPALRILLGAVFIWFGALKVSGNSPVAAMVAGTLPFANADLVVPVLGAVEVLLGLALVSGVGLRVALPALVAHLAGTFLTFVMLPGQMFRGSDPLLLTQSGEFVTKNLVLVCAGLVLIAHGRRGSPARELAQA